MSSALERLEVKQREIEFGKAEHKLLADIKYRYAIVDVVKDRKKALQGLSKLARTVTFKPRSSGSATKHLA